MPLRDESEAALAGLRVLDLTTEVAGPYCSMLLAGLGADVVKVEPPGGDPARRWPPFAGSGEDPERGLLFLHLNRGKHSVVLDPAVPADRAVLPRLAAASDLVLVDDAPERALEPWGLSPAGLQAESPALVVVGLPAFPGGGEWDGWAATELIVAAASGIASCTGEADREPLKVGGYPCLIAQGQTAAVAALAALRAARSSGTGSVVEVAAVEAAADLLEMWACGLYQDRPMPRLGRRHNSNYPFEVYPARDGFVGVHAMPGAWADFVEMVGAPELADPGYEQQSARATARSVIDPVIERWLAGLGKIEAYHAGQARRFAFGYVATVEDLVDSPQLRAREFFRHIAHPSAPDGRYPGAPFRMASSWRHERAPLLDEHGPELRASIERLPPRRTPRPPAGAAISDLGPLAGIVVLDLTQIWAGPRATKVLSDWGADVIKIESPSRTDGTRGFARYVADREAGTIASERDHNRRTQFEQLHRGERSVLIDLRSPEGRDAFYALARRADVVIANFAAGVVDRLGIGWADLKRVNPRLVLLSMTSFGDTGPEKDYVAYGVTQEELSGLYGLTGYEPGEPLKSGSNVGDPMNGMHGAVAVLATLHERDRTGRGQYIELSQLESSVVFLGDALLDYTVNGRVTRPGGNAHPVWAPHGVYPTRGTDEWIALVVRGDVEWDAVVEVLGVAEWRHDPRFATAEGRVRHRVELDAAVSERMKTRDRHELASALQSRGVAAAPVLNSIEVQYHPAFEASGFVQVMEHPDGGRYRYFGPLWRVNGQRPQLSRPAPLLGEHQREVFADLPGVAEAVLEVAATS